MQSAVDSGWLYKHPWITCQKIKHNYDPRSLRMKATFSCEVIHAKEIGWQSSVRLHLIAGLPTHLVQALNVWH